MNWANVILPRSAMSLSIRPSTPPAMSVGSDKIGAPQKEGDALD